MNPRASAPRSSGVLTANENRESDRRRRPRRAKGLGLGLVASLCSLGCAPRPIFPEEAKVVVLPLRAPLVSPEPSVLVTLPGREGPWSAWMFVDTGVPDSVILTPASSARLGLPQYVDRGETQVQIFNQPVQSAREGVLSNLQLGDLVVRNVPVMVTHLDNPRFRSGIVGQGVLGHAPWEIDWDRGTLTLGARPWPDEPGTIVVPVARLDGGDVVTVEIDGKPIPMELDTGTNVSVIPVEVAQAAGLSMYDVDRRRHTTGKQISGDTVLGPVRLGRIDFPSTSNHNLDFGLLGLDVLSRYSIQVIPGERLALRPRGDSWDTAPQRIARWPWTRACSSMGCLKARLEPVGNDARLVFSFEVDVPYPVELLLGCREADPVGSHLVTVSERLSSGRASGPTYHLSLRVASAAKDQPLETMVPAGNRWLSRTRCPQPSVLDVMPLRAEQIAPGTVSTELMF